MRHSTVVVVGAGITGIGAAHYLGKRGISYVVLEAASELGGVWNRHRWHGARCDSDIVKYSFSFKPMVSDQCMLDRAEIQAYLRSVAQESGVLEHIHFATRVTKATFDTHQCVWHVETNHEAFTAQFLFNGNGYFAERPHVPSFEGMQQFGGEILHAADLDGDRTFADRDVVVVGSGSTAISCAPSLAKVSKSLVLLQRSPSYVFDMHNSSAWLARVLPTALVRWGLQLKDDLIFVAFRRFPRVARAFFRRHWESAVGARLADEHFTPRYNPWEQRIPIAVGLKDAIAQGRVVMQTATIKRFGRHCIELNNGKSLPCDVCVLATGFNLDFLKFELRVDEKRIAVDGINCYKGIMMGGIPNYFHPAGVWHSAWTERSERTAQFAIRIIEHMRSRGLRSVSIERRHVEAFTAIQPGYVTRYPNMPRLYGTFELPSVDNVLSFHFSPGHFQFS